MSRYLIDKIDGCVGAWGEYRLRRDSVDGAIRLRKGSDNSVIDIPSCGKYLCETTINKHLAVSVVNLLGANGNFPLDSNADGLSDGWQSWTAANRSVSNNVQSFTGTAQYSNINAAYSRNVGDIIYTSAYISSQSGGISLQLVNNNTYPSSVYTGSGNFEFLSIRNIAITTGVDKVQIQDNNATNWKPVLVKTVYVINLTAVFGIGNEPTKAWMDNLIQSNPFFVNYQDAMTNGYVTALRDTSPPKYVKLVNLLEGAGNFESVDLGYWGSAGSPTVSTDIAKAGNKSLKCFGNISTLVLKDISVATGNKLYLCTFAYINRYTAGSIGVAMFDFGGALNGINGTVNNSILNKWQFASVVKTSANGGIRLYNGCFSAANADAYLDSTVLLDLTAIFGAGNEPTQAQMDTIMQRALSEGYFENKVVIRPTDATTAGLSNQPKWINGIKFDGMDDYFVIPNYPEIDFLVAPMSLVTFFKHTSTISYIFSKNLAGSDDMQYAIAVVGNQLVVYFKGTIPAQFDIPVAYLNKDICMIFTWYGTKLDIWVNGEFIRTCYVPDTLISRPNVSIGRRAPSNGYFGDRVHEIMIFNKALSEREIKKITKYFI